MTPGATGLWGHSLRASPSLQSQQHPQHFKTLALQWWGKSLEPGLPPGKRILCPSQWLHIPICAAVSSRWQSHSSFPVSQWHRVHPASPNSPELPRATAPGTPQAHVLLLIWDSPESQNRGEGTQLQPSNIPATIARMTHGHQMPRPCGSERSQGGRRR